MRCLSITSGRARIISFIVLTIPAKRKQLKLLMSGLVYTRHWKYEYANWINKILIYFFHALLFSTGYFIREIENFFPVFPYVIETLKEAWENLKWHGNTRPVAGLVFPLQFLVLSNFHSCFLTVWKRGKWFLYFLHITSYYFIYIYIYYFIYINCDTNRKPIGNGISSICKRSTRNVFKRKQFYMS